MPDKMGDEAGEFKTFSLEAVNYFLLRKQHLTVETREEDIAGIARDIGGLHATSATTPYLSLFARMEDFTREQLEEKLYGEKKLAKLRGVRGTVYIHPLESIPAAYASNRRMNIPNSEQYYRYMDRSEEEYEHFSRRVLKLLEGRGMTAREVKQQLGERKSVSAALNLMCDYGLLIRGAPSGGWKSNIHTYHRFADYLPGVDLEAVDERSARETMIGRYLAAFGPARENDIAWWTAFRKGEVCELLGGMGDDVSRMSIEGLDGEFIMLASQLPELVVTSPPGEDVVCLLPLLDPYLMAYKERDRYLSHRHYYFIYDRSGNATNSILVNGKIAGVWEYTEDGTPTMKLHFVAKISKKSMQAVRKQASRLGAFIGGGQVQLKECAGMTPLNDRTAGSFMTPLKDCRG